jgi:hypothetical protein
MEIFHNREITFLIVKVGGGAEDIVGRQGLGKSQLRTEDAPGNVVVVGSVPCRVVSEVHVDGSLVAQAANVHHGQTQGQQESDEVPGAKRA